MKFTFLHSHAFFLKYQKMLIPNYLKNILLEIFVPSGSLNSSGMYLIKTDFRFLKIVYFRIAF